MEPPPCDGCLGSRVCWVCNGIGMIEPRRERLEPCHRCYGSGICSYCQTVTIADLGHPPALEAERRRWSRRRVDDGPQADPVH